MQARSGHHPRIRDADGLAAAVTASRPGGVQAGAGAFLNEATLGLRQAREDVEHRLAIRRGGIDGAVL